MSMPRATVRLQLHRGFTLDDARAQVPYYAQLGVSHFYLSPITRARSGSLHGYDVVDHSTVNPELGGEPALAALAQVLRRHGMGLVLDIVPNHMAAHPDNAWWWDVLRLGTASPHAQWFDIDWQPADPALRGKVLAPFLPEPYGSCLGKGDIRLVLDGGGISPEIEACGMRYPIAPDTLRLAGMDSCVARKQYDGRLPDGRQRLHALLERQHYRLAWWRCAADCINWRRFFEINELIGVCVERPEVFDAVHELPLRLYAEGLIDGLRIDHVDGLARPLDYCRRLRAELDARSALRPAGLAGDRPWLIVEKILAAGEVLGEDWQVDGTSGYDFMDQAGAVLHDPSGKEALSQVWEDVSGGGRSAQDYVKDARCLMLRRHFVAERKGLLRVLSGLAQAGVDSRDWSVEALGRMLDELLIAFPVYRSYAGESGRNPSDARLFAALVKQVRDSLAPDEYELKLLDWLDNCLGGAPLSTDEAVPGVSPRLLQREAVRRFQQLTPPLAAKSVEDTAFYRFGRLISRNEVGADPDVFSISPEDFHQRNAWRAEHARYALLATATHDHKRGEDVRARLAVVSEIPDEWAAASGRWMRWPEAGYVPDSGSGRAQRYMLFQTMVGAWPLDLDADDAAGVDGYIQRLGEWQVKAMREAKLDSSWFQPNVAHENAAMDFLDNLRPGRALHALLRDIAAFAERLAPAGAVNSLSQVVLRMMSPGVPDLYQGTEFWDFSLVDPDNRRPVDYDARRAALHALDGGLPDLRAVLPDWKTGRIKQAVLARLLEIRRRVPRVFSSGRYIALPVQGARQAHVLAFLLCGEGQHVLVVAPRLVAGGIDTASGGALPAISPDFWEDTALVLPRRHLGAALRDSLRGSVMRSGPDGTLRLADVLSGLPVAVLLPDQG
ncbi:malto-oligosyltrehalose synthase [Pollutimonas sp. M17]|uniref:malto-oligosyltrehalose synthase n=1 Tax=Pollutimonas sp. M17 TaxID=2962065 RepID=UPI0021F43C37|nr:malto-oligosyltrehalose synthase [Pollutimonas sp. M17]UYO93481.1 malto-oligosyltrehalose synthase [Pollutimonas sp. M17]